MQKLIGFDDAQSKRLADLEFKFLIDVQKAENCCWCNKKKRVEKLKQRRDTELQEILSRNDYIKYEGGKVEKIKDYPVRVE